jgi:hypothetical protein
MDRDSLILARCCFGSGLMTCGACLRRVGGMAIVTSLTVSIRLRRDPLAHAIGVFRVAQRRAAAGGHRPARINTPATSASPAISGYGSPRLTKPDRPDSTSQTPSTSIPTFR